MNHPLLLGENAVVTKSSVIANVILVPCSKAITISKSR
jgi:hypothetical protein